MPAEAFEVTPSAAEALERREPLAATLMLRSMIDFSLDRAKYKRYGHAARHLQTCGYLAKRIEDFGEHLDHDVYVAGLKARHGRKYTLNSVAFDMSVDRPSIPLWP